MEEVESTDYQLRVRTFGPKEHFVRNESCLTFAVSGSERRPFDYNLQVLLVACIDPVDNCMDLVKMPLRCFRSFLHHGIETCLTFVVVEGYTLAAEG